MHIMKTPRTAADWANLALHALDEAGLSLDGQVAIIEQLTGWIDIDDYGNFYMRHCKRCDESAMLVAGNQICQRCGVLL